MIQKFVSTFFGAKIISSFFVFLLIIQIITLTNQTRRRRCSLFISNCGTELVFLFVIWFQFAFFYVCFSSDGFVCAFAFAYVRIKARSTNSFRIRIFWGVGLFHYFLRLVHQHLYFFNWVRQSSGHTSVYNQRGDKLTCGVMKLI